METATSNQSSALFGSSLAGEELSSSGTVASTRSSTIEPLVKRDAYEFSPEQIEISDAIAAFNPEEVAYVRSFYSKIDLS